jgi:hypothetical protein
MVVVHVFRASPKVNLFWEVGVPMEKQPLSKVYNPKLFQSLLGLVLCVKNDTEILGD